MQKAREAAASAKSCMEKTKATLEEKVSWFNEIKALMFV